MSTVTLSSSGSACAGDRDLATAGSLQHMLLPPSPFSAHGWTAGHRYQPATTVSGDYVDLVAHGDRLYFMLGDVAGKGVAASLLMAQLHAMFRTLIPFGLPLEDLMRRASALLCTGSLPAQYATLVAGYLEPNGAATIGNAGHPPPLTITAASEHGEVRATGVPLGLFCESQFTATKLGLSPGDTLLVYSDGLSEAQNADGDEYGPLRVRTALAGAATLPVEELLDVALLDQERFRAGRPNTDDVTLLAIRRT